MHRVSLQHLSALLLLQGVILSLAAHYSEFNIELKKKQQNKTKPYKVMLRLGGLCRSGSNICHLRSDFVCFVCSAAFTVLCCVWSKRCRLWRAVQLLFVSGLLTLLISALHCLPDKLSADRGSLLFCCQINAVGKLQFLMNQCKVYISF